MKMFSIILFTACVIGIVNSYKSFRYEDDTGTSQLCPIFREKMRMRLVTRPRDPFHGVDHEVKETTERRLPLTTAYYTEIIHPVNETHNEPIDPLDTFSSIVDEILFGEVNPMDPTTQKIEVTVKLSQEEVVEDPLLHFPSGSIMRAERFAGHSSVHMSGSEGIHRGHAGLRLTPDYMQTAVDAFFFFTDASLKDVLNMPSDYILRSARTIAMMSVNLEKLSATWQVVKGDMKPEEVSIELLELYRPLFKYLSPREIASLNLTDEKIMTYIGTHPDLGRHQVGAVASRYIKINPRWSEAQYLNLLGNVMCGIPISVMRKLETSNFLQLNHQVFFHIRACDPLQRRFYLSMMTKTQVLGKPYSWTARDVTRMGLLLPLLKSREIGSITPDAMAGITAQVMQEIPSEKLKYLTEIQMKHLQEKSYNIMARRIRAYEDANKNNSQPTRSRIKVTLVLAAWLLII